jgi:hypothetical protein
VTERHDPQKPSTKPEPFLPHLRRKGPQSKFRWGLLIDPLESGSIHEMVPALVTVGEEIFLGQNMPRSAYQMNKFIMLMDAAKDIRRRKLIGSRGEKIGRTVQHDEMSKKWGELFDENFWSTFKEEMEEWPALKDWKPWDLAAVKPMEGLPKRWFSLEALDRSIWQESTSDAS